MKYLAAILTMLYIFSVNVTAQEVDYRAFLKETQKITSEPGKVSLVWWLPIEFWELAFKKQISISEVEKMEIMKVLRPYTIYAVVDGRTKTGDQLEIIFTPTDSIVNTIEIIDQDGKTYKPLKVKELDPNIQSIFEGLKPSLKLSLGQFGENVNFIVFSDENENKQRVSDPYAEGVLKIKFCSKVVEWTTPLVSLAQLKICPVDTEKMNGTWNFCPIHGNELIQKK